MAFPFPKRLVLLLMVSSISRRSTQLIINVSSGEPDSVPYRQVIAGNSSSETVSVSLVTPAGNGVHHLTDFKAGLTITAVTVPGQQELGQPNYQLLCFVSPITADVIIPAEAITKLRQKHREAVRIAEERRGREVQDNTVSLMVTKSQNLSPYIASLCMEAKQTTFAPEQILQQYKDGRVGYRRDGRRLTNFPINKKYSTLRRCSLQSYERPEPCLCQVDSCLDWYPCSLKYCRNNNGDGGERRCGIRTCSKCYEMRFTAKSRYHCSWDVSQ